MISCVPHILWQCQHYITVIMPLCDLFGWTGLNDVNAEDRYVHTYVHVCMVCMYVYTLHY